MAVGDVGQRADRPRRRHDRVARRPAHAAAAGQDMLDADGMRVQLPESFRPPLQRYAGRRVVFGVRPEDIAASQGAGNGSTVTTSTEKSAIKFLAHDFWTGNGDGTSYPTALSVGSPFQRIQ